MELQTNDKVSVITNDNEKENDIGLNNVTTCNSSNITDESTSKTESIVTDHVMLNNSISAGSFKTDRKRKRLDDEEIERKRIAQEEYDRELHEQRYKRLMHLLNRSQFYANFLTQKISQNPTEEIKVNSDEDKLVSVVNGNTSPRKKGKKKNTGEYDIRQYIIPKTEKGIVSSRSQLNLSEEEIAKELLTCNETTPLESCEKSSIPKYFNGTLYKYQIQGLDWLKVLYENGLNGILADEMGLGKTVQIIALLCHLIEKRQSGPYLIIVPLSTMPNWISEFKKFAPSLPVIFFHGPKKERVLMCKKIKQFHHVMGEYRTQPIVLTTYETPLYESNFFKTQKWRYIIIDEGHRIKNSQCRLIKVLRTLHSTNRLLLTGTPLQNNLAELWSLLNFLLPEIFDDLAVFESWFNFKELMDSKGTEKLLKQEQEKQILSSLREILQPFILRRVKSDVHLNIPPKKELVVYAPLTHLQLNLYKAVLNRDIYSDKAVEDSILPVTDYGKPKRRCVLRNATNVYGDYTNDRSHENDENSLLMESVLWKTETEKERIRKYLMMWKQYINVDVKNRDYLIRIMASKKWITYKKIVNHPYLLYHPLDFTGLPKIDDDIIKSSGKLMVMDAMLAKLKSQGHKVLIFSTMTMILDVIENYLSLREYTYVRLDGTYKIEERNRDIQRFNNDPDMFLFLISTKAGGTGLNLAAADTVIIYDSDWNPQVDIQAMARCHRIGQTRPVVIYKLCTKGTIDETIIHRAEAKRILEKMVISKELRKLKVLNTETLMEFKKLLESKEFKVVTSTREVFTEAELNDLLDRSDLMVQ